jgi:hypothetical protein
MDKASNYFLLTEMFRGMYVVLEQFFRPPYVSPSLVDQGRTMGQYHADCDNAATRSTIHSRKVQSLPDSEANTH